MDVRNQKRPLLTLTERNTRFALAAERLEVTGEAATGAQLRLLGGLLPHAQRSVTYVEGSELAGHEQVAEQASLTNYPALTAR